jgi:hypothetical protein
MRSVYATYAEQMLRIVPIFLSPAEDDHPDSNNSSMSISCKTLQARAIGDYKLKKIYF